MENKNLTDQGCSRSRSNTWPRNIQPELENNNNNIEGQQHYGRRNIYGEFSYADLITQAILSSPEKRLSLAKIYEWMIENVPVFRNRPQGYATASWKNSVRHNLSLHSKFVRVQSPNCGKTFYWTLNTAPQKKESIGRKRSDSMGNKFEKYRQRAKRFLVSAFKKSKNKKEINNSQQSVVPELEATQHYVLPQTESSPVYVRPVHQFSESYRQRTWSNVSNCTTILSTIPSAESISNFSEGKIDAPLYHQLYQNYDQFRHRCYSAGSSYSDFQDYSQNYSPAQTYQLPQYTTDQNFDNLSDTFQANVSLQTASTEYPNNNDYFYQRVHTGYQYAMSVIQPENTQNFQSDMNPIQDIDSIQVESFQGHLNCNVEEVIKKELELGETFDISL